jgi:hypothetical protein
MEDLTNEQVQRAILVELQKQTALLVTLCRHQEDSAKRLDTHDRALGMSQPIRTAESMPRKEKARAPVGVWNPATWQIDPIPAAASADS